MKKQKPFLRTLFFRGLHGVLAIIRPETTPGKIRFRAKAKGLKEASLVIAAK